MNEINDILEELKNQAQDTMKELTGKLSKDLEESAAEHGAIKREREVKDAKLLLQVLFVYATSNLSQKMLAVCAFLMGAGNISDQAWQKKIICCIPWLTYLLNDVLLALSLKDRGVYQGEIVHLLDGSIFKQVGKNGKELRLHMDYNLTSGAMEEIKITDIHTAESVQVLAIKAGHIYVGDAGFGKGKNLAYTVSCKANALFRMSPNHVSLATDSKGKNKINMLDKLNTKTKVVDFNCFIHSSDGKYIPVRIIASRLPEDKALLAKERKRRKASKKQSKLKEETLVYAEWVILMTSLNSSYSAERLLEMYRTRWQIELLFKRIKQFFKVTRLRKATLEHSMALVLIWLIVWAMTERQAIAAEIYLLEKGADMELYSPWAVNDFFFRRFQTVINSLWVFSFDFNLHFLTVYRHLRNHKGRRLNQYALFRFGCASPMFLCDFAIAA